VRWWNSHIGDVPDAVLGVGVLVEDLGDLLPALGDHHDGAAAHLEARGLVVGGDLLEDGAFFRFRREVCKLSECKKGGGWDVRGEGRCLERWCAFMQRLSE